MVSSSDSAVGYDLSVVEVGYRFPFSQVIEESKQAKLISVQPVFIVVKRDTTAVYMCPLDYTVIVTVKNGIAQINMPDDLDSWYRRETCPSGCNHFRWFLFSKEEFGKIRVDATAILESRNILFVLVSRRKGFPAVYKRH